MQSRHQLRILAIRPPEGRFGWARENSGRGLLHKARYASSRSLLRLRPAEARAHEEEKMSLVHSVSAFSNPLKTAIGAEDAAFCLHGQKGRTLFIFHIGFALPLADSVSNFVA